MQLAQRRIVAPTGTVTYEKGGHVATFTLTTKPHYCFLPSVFLLPPFLFSTFHLFTEPQSTSAGRHLLNESDFLSLPRERSRLHVVTPLYKSPVLGPAPGQAHRSVWEIGLLPNTHRVPALSGHRHLRAGRHACSQRLAPRGPQRSEGRRRPGGTGRAGSALCEPLWSDSCCSSSANWRLGLSGFQPPSGF